MLEVKYIEGILDDLEVEHVYIENNKLCCNENNYKIDLLCIKEFKYNIVDCQLVIKDMNSSEIYKVDLVNETITLIRHS